jgi:2,3,4,5-tetrahydropyridine-2-carboxylate N-succinyltransferase
MAGDLQAVIERAWEERDTLGSDTKGEIRQAVDAAIAALDSGEAPIAEKDGEWIVHQWLKKAVLLSFRLNPMEAIGGGPGGAHWWDKVPSKFAGWGDKEFTAAAFRAVPGAIVRRGAFIAPGAVLMPSFVSCAQIGRNVHISGGTGIGGVLEPLQAGPVIIEDDCFIGARSEVAEGVIIERGSVLSMGVFLGASTKIVDRASGEVRYGRVPEYSVVVPGTLPAKDGGPALACAVIVKRVDERTRSKTSINELLRD